MVVFGKSFYLNFASVLMQAVFSLLKFVQCIEHNVFLYSLRITDSSQTYQDDMSKNVLCTITFLDIFNSAKVN